LCGSCLSTRRHDCCDRWSKGCVSLAHAFVGRLRQWCTTFVDEVDLEGLEECLVEGALGLICAGIVDRGGMLQCCQHGFESFEEQQTVILGRADKAQSIRDLPLSPTREVQVERVEDFGDDSKHN
jgi:hypothetical protein